MSLPESFTEALLEEAAIEILESMGYTHAFGPDISPGGDAPERQDHREVILKDRVKDALFKINRDLPEVALKEAFRQIITFNSPMLEENNRHFHKLLVEGSRCPLRRTVIFELSGPLSLTSKIKI